MTSKKYQINNSPSDFSERLYNNLEVSNLLKLNIIQHNIDNIFFRGNIRIKKIGGIGLMVLCTYI